MAKEQKSECAKMITLPRSVWIPCLAAPSRLLVGDDQRNGAWWSRVQPGFGQMHCSVCVLVSSRGYYGPRAIAPLTCALGGVGFNGYKIVVETSVLVYGTE